MEDDGAQSGAIEEKSDDDKPAHGIELLEAMNIHCENKSFIAWIQNVTDFRDSIKGQAGVVFGDFRFEEVREIDADTISISLKHLLADEGTAIIFCRAADFGILLDKFTIEKFLPELQPMVFINKVSQQGSKSTWGQTPGNNNVFVFICNHPV